MTDMNRTSSWLRHTMFLILAVSLPGALYAQSLKTGNQTLDQAFSRAVWTLDTNIHDGIIHAGAGYGGEWTRDCAINCWNAASLLHPAAAEQSLWSVTEDSLRIGHQYWDKILWVMAAWNHYLINGDRQFLEKAYACSTNTMQELESDCWERHYGLFMGPAVFQDGIAAYPEPIYDSAKWDDSFVLHHKYSLTIKCLSTNVAYYMAYRTLAEMAREQNAHGMDQERWQSQADLLKANIRKYFMADNHGRLYYLIDHRGVAHNYQEGMGLGLLLLTDILSESEAAQVVAHAYSSANGIPSVYPCFPRYSEEKPGRHNAMIWPHVNAFYAAGCAHQHQLEPFRRELDNIARLAMQDRGGNFYEIYTLEGEPSGGWQCGALWDKKPHQTWCATGYLNLMLRYVFGLKPSKAGLELNPLGLGQRKRCQLTGLHYRNAVLNLTLKGEGSIIKSFKINGKDSKLLIPADIEGNVDVVIEFDKN